MTAEGFDWRPLAVPVYGPALLFGLGHGSIVPVIALSARNLGASVAMAALVVTLIGIGSLLTNIPASLITTRFGERRAIIGASAWCALAMGVCIAAGSLWVFSAGIFMIGMASAVFHLARQTYLTETVPARFRARALSTLGGTMRIGVFAGPFVSAGAIHFLGLAGAYWVGTGALLVSGVVAIGMRDLPHHPGATSRTKTRSQATGNGSQDAGRQGAAGGTAAAGAVGSAASVRSIARTHAGVLRTVGIGVVLVAVVRSSRPVVIPLWAENIGLDPGTAALIYGVSGAIDMLLFYPAGKLMDQKGRPWVAVPCMVIMGLALILVPFTVGTVSLLVAAVLIGFGNGIGSGMIMTLGSDYSPPVGRTKFLGVWRLMADAGSSGGPALLSSVTALATLSAGIWVVGGIGLAGAMLLGYFLPRVHPADDAGPR
ncbi:MFS transporter [Arthrobacter castelli]|uniref:MFS transporter n=1 Tax=Arthrobacter castelli TaxID=271431 RepID=UPI0003F9E4A1|nr:MFS transporter [Arthrobacter castelli]